MFKVGIIGPESSGKSTLAHYLAKRYHGVYVPEYGRTFVEQKGTTDVTWDELCAIARHQIEGMRGLGDEGSRGLGDEGIRGLGGERSRGLGDEEIRELVVFDTELIVTKVWFDYAFGKVPQWLDEAIHCFPMDVYLLTKPDIPWVQDPARSNGSDAIRQELFERYQTEIEALNIPYYIIEHV